MIFFSDEGVNNVISRTFDRKSDFRIKERSKEMKKLIAFGIVGGIAGVVGFVFGAIPWRSDNKDLKKKLSNRDKEIDYMKRQVEKFRFELDELRKGECPYIVGIEDIIKLSDDCFEWFEYEGCALHLEDEE